MCVCVCVSTYLRKLGYKTLIKCLNEKKKWIYMEQRIIVIEIPCTVKKVLNLMLYGPKRNFHDILETYTTIFRIRKRGQLTKRVKSEGYISLTTNPDN